MDSNVYEGPPLPKRVRTAFAYLEYLQSRLQPCCHPPGELTKQELATERVALRCLAEYLACEQDFVDPPEPEAEAKKESNGSKSESKD